MKHLAQAEDQTTLIDGEPFKENRTMTQGLPGCRDKPQLTSDQHKPIIVLFMTILEFLMRPLCHHQTNVHNLAALGGQISGLLNRLKMKNFTIFREYQHQITQEGMLQGSNKEIASVITHLKISWLERLHQWCQEEFCLDHIMKKLADKQARVMTRNQLQQLAGLMLVVEKNIQSKRMFVKPGKWSSNFLAYLLLFQPLCAHIPVVQATEHVVMESMGTLAGSTSYLHVHLELPFAEVEDNSMTTRECSTKNLAH